MLGLSGDAAIATLNGQRPWLPVQLCGFKPVGLARASRLGEVLTKSGRSIGSSRARVDGEGIYRIRYEVSPGVVEPRDIRGFKLTPEKPGNPDNEELSTGGDSGSLWISPNSGEAVGLHFAGETNPVPTAEHAIACHLTEVLEELEELDIRLATFDDLMALEDTATDTAAATCAEYTPRPDGPYPEWPFPDWSSLPARRRLALATPPAPLALSGAVGSDRPAPCRPRAHVPHSGL